MSIGKGIAIAGIWIGTGIACIGGGDWVPAAVFFAAMATVVTAVFA